MLSGEAHWTQVLRWNDMEWVIKAVEWIQSGKMNDEKDC
jgi:hypothetical protein